MASVFYIGQTVRLEVTFTDRAGTKVDPTTVTASVTDPASTVTAPSVIKASTGVYYADVTVSVADDVKVWRYSFTGTGSNPQKVYGTFKVLLAP